MGGVPLKSVGASILLEDYKLWQRELEKQDRWFSQSIWTVLAGTSAGLLLIRSLPLPERAFAECAIVGVVSIARPMGPGIDVFAKVMGPPDRQGDGARVAGDRALNRQGHG
ncbi:MAG: hypothetical protein ACLQIJ_17820, partial [Polyangia bacterium]